MSNSIYFSSNSPTSSVSSRGKSNKIYKEDLERFVKKYEKEMNKIMVFSKEIPPEIYILKLIVAKYKDCQGKKIAISEVDRDLLNCMITMNKEIRAANNNPTPRLRDRIIDTMINYFDLEHEVKSRYISFKDLF